MKPRASVSALDVAVDCLAVARLSKLWTDDEVWPVKEAREAFLRQAGDTRWADLAECKWCCSWWFALAALAARYRFPRAWNLLARALAASQVTGTLAELGDR